MEPTKSTKQKRSTGVSTSRPISAPSDHGWAALLSRHIVARGRPAGEGWMSAGELAPVMKLTVRNVRPKLVALALSGDW